MTRANSVLYLGSGLMAVLVTPVPGGPTGGSGYLLACGLSCTAMGLVLLVTRARVSGAAHHVLVLLSWALATSAILLSGGGGAALAIASYYVLVVVNIVAVSSWLVAAAYLLLNVVSLIGSLLAVGTGSVAQLAMSCGVLVLLSAFVALLVRAIAAAEVDPLTGLLNRRGLDARLTLPASPSGRSGGPVSLALVAIDHFSRVNDTLGYAAGDQTLRTVARTWSSLVPSGATFGRWRGDAFALLVPASEEELTTLVAALRASLPQGLTCTAGTAEHTDGESGSLFAGRAEAALYHAKRTMRGRTAGHGEAAAEGRRLHAALADHEIEAHFQPVVALADGSVTGAEALIRWRHPERGLVPPDSFIPVAELSGVIVDLGRYVVRESCRQAATWPRLPDGTPRRVNVNASGRELAEDDYATFVLGALQEFCLPSAALVVEITEGGLDTDSPVVTANLAALREAGIRLALDDFGTGQSSLARLAHLDVSILKIDRSFVAPINAAGDVAPLVSAVLGLAGAMGLDVVAEGIETDTQADWLRSAGCAKGQGYLYSKALPAAEFSRWLAAHERVPGAVAGVTAPAGAGAA